MRGSRNCNDVRSSWAVVHQSSTTFYLCIYMYTESLLPMKRASPSSRIKTTTPKTAPAWQDASEKEPPNWSAPKKSKKRLKYKASVGRIFTG